MKGKAQKLLKAKTKLIVLLAVIGITIWTIAFIPVDETFRKTAEIKQRIGLITTVDGTTSSGEGYIEGESIMQIVSELDLADGDYTLRVIGQNNAGSSETIDYEIELINYKEDVRYSLSPGETEKTVSLGNSTADARMLVIKYWGDLTIDDGVTVTAATRKKGMYIHVVGDTMNNGEITMTAKGSSATGENVYLWKNADSSYEYIPAQGANGVAARKPYPIRGNGINGNNAQRRATGGGGQGAAIINQNNGAPNSYIGASTGGTSYGGGNGSGAVVRCNSSALAASYTQASSSAGGNGNAYDSGSNTYYFAGGGAGITGGTSSYCHLSSSNTQTKAESGVGGLLIFYTNQLQNDGKISSNGSNGAGASCNLSGSYRGAVGGGGSGGGSVNIFYNKAINLGNITATGGNGGDVSKCKNGNMGMLNGGNGGDGSVTATNVLPELNYTEKEIIMAPGETYKIDSSKIQLVNQSNLQQAGNVRLETIQYTTLDTKIASVTTNGMITAIEEGQTKIKMTDLNNGLETYLWVKVRESTDPRLSTGNGFTVALKQNGTVWTYGENTTGQLGNAKDENSNIPVQVVGENGQGFLENVKQIATGYHHSVVLTKNGEIYTWGAGENGQLGVGNNENSNIPVKVEGLSHIVKVDAYQNTTVALDKDGKVYIWGEGYSILPMRLISSQKMVDVSGKIFLSQEGMVYCLPDLENAISGLSRIAKISCGTDHYLAISVNGYAYSWGENNTYGELAKTGNSITETVGKDVIEIAAGNDISLLRTQDNKLYVAGNNNGGLIGQGTVAKVSSMTLVEMDEEVEVLAVGEGSHTGIVDTNGNVWMTGNNTNGECGTGDNTNITSFTKIGETIVISNTEDCYLDIKEKKEIICSLINTFNLKIDVVDNEQTNFSVTVVNTECLEEDEHVITALNYGISEVTITHLETGKTKTITIKVMKKMDDIIQGIRDCNLTDGIYEILVNEEIYKIELYNYKEDTTYELVEGEENKVVNLGNDNPDETMLVVKYHKNLTVGKGVTLTPTVRKKGMYVCVLGKLDNQGEITMTARGANSEGQNVYLWKNIDNSYEYVPANGAEGLVPFKPRYTRKGIEGNNGIGRQTGSGGQGSAIINTLKGSIDSYIGASTGGNSYAGGNGSGAIVRCNSSALAASYTQASSIAGGNGNAYDSNTPTQYFAGGGAGITGGTSSYCRASVGKSQTKAEDGVGGLLMLYADLLNNTGKISSEGSKGAGGSIYLTGNYCGAVGGAGSGGGSINIFANTIQDAGDITAAGGKGGEVIVTGQRNMGVINGADGGDGTVTITELKPYLNYEQKEIVLKVQDTYIIQKQQIGLVELNQNQTIDKTLGNIEYEILDTTVAELDSSTNVITALKEGKTKLKITDTTNQLETYVYITVQNSDKAKIVLGKDFTIALKENGTVWTAGSNEKGTLGVKLQANSSNKEVNVIESKTKKPLKNIQDIAAGTQHVIAVDKNGIVYEWGTISKVTRIQNTDGNVTIKEEQEILYEATKVEGLSNIQKVAAYGNKSLALSKEGNVWIWGKEYEKPVLLDISGIIAIDDDLLLSNKGKVYLVSDLENPISLAKNIAKISKAEDHTLLLSTNGMVYSIGSGENGQCRNWKSRR